MRIALGIEYDGHSFYGWQAQAGLVTIQGTLEEALSKIANHPVTTFCAGRTDAGVHALGQVIHFDTHAVRDEKAWITGVNTNLPSSIAVQWMRFVDDEFHARFSALSRRYQYVIYNHKHRSALLSNRVVWVTSTLDEKNMQIAANFLLGENDFSAFRSSQCESRTPMRNVHEITVRRQNHFIILEIEANAFLHHMVRNIVGTLLKVGIGKIAPSTVDFILKGKDRKAAFATAPAHGLYLAKVKYPSTYLLPDPLHALF